MESSQQFMPLRARPIGLLTTVANLHPEYKIRYSNPYNTTIESPLDLTVKPLIDVETPPSTPSPLKRNYHSNDDCDDYQDDGEDEENNFTNLKYVKTELKLTIQKEVTPKKPIKTVSAQKTSKQHPPKEVKEKKHKAVRKLKFDENKSSPVSGTIIRPLEEINENVMEPSGDIDPQYNIVEVTDEAKAELAIISNVIGAYVCKLCRIEFDDAFGLARHRCSCIVLLEYRCPECGKRFNCPANLASHRRWHKPKEKLPSTASNTQTIKTEIIETNEQYPCNECGKTFKRQAYLRKHLSTHRKDTEIKIQKLDSSDSCSRDSLNDNQESREQQQYTKIIYRSESSAISTSSSDFDTNESDNNSMPPTKYRIFSNTTFTEEENMAAAALANLRSCSSVIKHTALAV